MYSAKSLQSSPTLYSMNCGLPGPLSVGFSRQEQEWGAISFLDPFPGIEPVFLISHALSGGFFPTNATWHIQVLIHFGKDSANNSNKKMLPLHISWLIASLSFKSCVFVKAWRLKSGLIIIVQIKCKVKIFWHNQVKIGS